MGNYEFKGYDFEHPSALFILEDKLKGILGRPLLYNPYFKTLVLTSVVAVGLVRDAWLTS